MQPPFIDTDELTIALRAQTFPGLSRKGPQRNVFCEGSRHEIFISPKLTMIHKLTEPPFIGIMYISKNKLHRQISRRGYRKRNLETLN